MLFVLIGFIPMTSYLITVDYNSARQKAQKAETTSDIGSASDCDTSQRKYV